MLRNRAPAAAKTGNGPGRLQAAAPTTPSVAIAAVARAVVTLAALVVVGALLPFAWLVGRAVVAFAALVVIAALLPFAAHVGRAVVAFAALVVLAALLPFA